ncbi:MAG TPA: UbiX family flavin prenyltransferase [Luteibacter sp.]|jgi:4-hydroxy-3-polyprenylbenzoate decarboxylase|nr:UbiX family flavin prenyltransferase [Luteibacter sp.]
MKELIVGITGASGAIYGVRLLEALRELEDVRTHLIVSPSGMRTLGEETGMDAAALRALADVHYSYKDIGAAVSSGSFRTAGMIVAPCSVRTLSGIANSYDADLMIRAADVCLKERRRVVLLLRETPLHAGHIDLMAKATAAGAIIMPPVPAFYTRPATLDDIINQTVARALDLFDIDVGLALRWTGSTAHGQGSATHGSDLPPRERTT